MCFAWISEQTAIISLYSINLSVFKTEAESVYCAVRNGSLNETDTVFVLKVLMQQQTAAFILNIYFRHKSYNETVRFVSTSLINNDVAFTALYAPLCGPGFSNRFSDSL
jgi:hypothetical protein